MVDVTVPELALALITVFEGCGPRNAQGLYIPYQDSGKVWTIGKGHTSGVAATTPPATQAQVDAWFAQDAAPLIAKVAGLPVLEGAVLVSFGYNCGAGALAQVMGGRSLMTQFVHDSNGNVLPGLVARRALESVLLALSQQL